MSTAQLTLTDPEFQREEPMSLIQWAIVNNASADQVERLFDLQLRLEAEKSRREYNEAMAQFKRNPPTITKNVQKKAGNMELHYASLDNVVDTLTQALSAVGIRHEWKVKQDQAMIAVTCILSHIAGHREETTISAVADNSGSKNSIQAIASTVTYLQRYTLLAATGMAAAGTDNDGGAAAGPAMPEKDVVAALDAIEAARNEDELKRVFNANYTEADKVGDKAAKAAFIKARDKRKAELR